MNITSGTQVQITRPGYEGSEGVIANRFGRNDGAYAIEVTKFIFNGAEVLNRPGMRLCLDVGCFQIAA